MKQLALVFVLLAFPTGGAGAIQPLVAGLSEYRVGITTDFTGAEIFAYGAIDRPGDVVVLLRGPERSVTMRRKERFFGVWVNAASMTLDQVPAYYAIASSRPLSDIASEDVLERHDMGLEHLRKSLVIPPQKASENIRREWKDAAVRRHQQQELYPEVVGNVVFLGDRLFSALIEMPANLPTGNYLAEFYLLIEGEVVAAEVLPLFVGKTGVEAEVYEFAHEYSALYGLIAILVALVAGWLAHVAFRKG